MVSVLGEIQHSLFLSTRHFKANGEIGPRRESGRNPFVPLFSWQGILPFKFQVPIGDPLLYSNELHTLLLESSSFKKSLCPVVMPKLNEELSPDDRINDYRRLIQFAADVTGQQSLTISLHPKDLWTMSALEKNTKVQILPARVKAEKPESLLDSLNRLKNAPLVISDYYGAHIFRANAFFGTPVVVNQETALHSAIDRNFMEYLSAFEDERNNPTKRIELSKLIVGQSHKKTPQELAEILFPYRSRPVTRVIVGSYKKGRIGLVRLRRLAELFRKARARIRAKLGSESQIRLEATSGSSNLQVDSKARKVE